jgi:ABC-type lipoprotein export system ATPase subunit
VLKLIRDASAEAGAGLVLVSHDPSVTRSFSKRLKLKAHAVSGRGRHE